MYPGLVQIAPGVFVTQGGAHQAVENRTLPASGFPMSPNGFKSRIRLPAGSVPSFDMINIARLNGELVLPVGLASISVLAESTGLRNALVMRNSSAAAARICIAFGKPATLNSIFLLTQDVMMLLVPPVFQDEVFAISDSAAGQLTLASSSMPGDFT